MPKTTILSILLSISLGVNVWFLWHLYSKTSPTHTASKQENENSLHNSNDVNENLPHGNTLQNIRDNEHSLEVERSHQFESNSSEEELHIVDQSTYFDYIKTLVDQQKYDILEYELSLYLRQYPEDIEALILEADTYLHLKPLNIALIHYQTLLSKNLSVKQREGIEKLIAVNTTRIVQQFSGDGAWDVLAEFLEPLVQIDPLNRDYLMALATAYGMQQQFTLMEDVLAALAHDDVRAVRLRENILARLDNSQVPMSLNDSINESDTPVEEKQPDVILKQVGKHFITVATMDYTRVTLLVDTGASTTAISKSKFANLSKTTLEFLGLFNINTAGGTIEAPIYKVSEFKLGKQKLKNISVMVLPDENLDKFDGLLGMNVLSQFDMAFDASKRTMRMYKKR